MRAMLPILSLPTFTFSLIPSASSDGGTTVATYEIMVNFGENAYAVYRRYSEFKALHDRVAKEFKEEGLPRFPGRKGLFGSTNHSPGAIERRRKELEVYIRQLVCSDAVRRSPPVREFFAQLSLDPMGGDSFGAAGGIGSSYNAAVPSEDSSSKSTSPKGSNAPQPLATSSKK
jgi:hypothetical protein